MSAAKAGEKAEVKELKLDFDFIPEESWKYNLRHILSPAAWDVIRRDAYKRAGYKCRICGRGNCRLEAHEKWSFDTKKREQKLEDVLALCHDCHAVVHYQRTALCGGEEGAQRAQEHFKKVNGCTQAEFHEALARAAKRHGALNATEDWQLNLSFLKRFI
ncbi:MAG: hypothetical protein ACI4SH_08250 [Candidatus Scatosoma sp.]